MNSLTRGLSDLVELFYPSLCVTCGDRLTSQEKYVCVQCWNDLPVTNFQQNQKNKVAQLFWGRVHIENVTAYFSYKKGSKYQQLIHSVKYKGMKELGLETGRRFGTVLSGSDNFANVDLVIPIPLHPKKQKQRGYNQSEWIARGISETLRKPVSIGNLKRNLHTSTQTRKNRYERWKNVENIFEVSEPDELATKHILLIDDIITTGSTIEACALQLLKIPSVKVSVASLGFADV